jgi:hypothetical protein
MDIKNIDLVEGLKRDLASTRKGITEASNWYDRIVSGDSGMYIREYRDSSGADIPMQYNDEYYDDDFYTSIIDTVLTKLQEREARILQKIEDL